MSEATTPKHAQSQHYVPRFLLKQFADSDGRIYCLNKKTDAITKPPPKHAAADDGFYEFQKGDEILSFEAKLQKVENAAAPVFGKSCESEHLVL